MTSSPLRSVPSESKSRPVATRRPATAVSRALKVGGAASGSDTLASSLARMSQQAALRNAMRSRSRATMMRVATDCTRPADNLGATFFHSTGLTS